MIACSKLHDVELDAATANPLVKKAGELRKLRNDASDMVQLNNVTVLDQPWLGGTL